MFTGSVPVISPSDPSVIQFNSGDVVEIVWTMSFTPRKYGVYDISKGTPAVTVGVGKLVLVGPIPDVVVTVGGVTMKGTVTV